MVVGLVIRLTRGRSIQEIVSFSYLYFFNFLLPPIILNSGFELHQASFFREIGTILTFALAGTFISAVVLGVILFIWTLIPLENFSISFVEAISLGATLSATDPVTILAIFQTFKVEPKLYTIIFGESILNDAIAIVMFQTAQKYKTISDRPAPSLSIFSFFEGVGSFVITFCVSLLIGVFVGIGTALALKYTHVRQFPKIETCLIILVAYATYFFSSACNMSGMLNRVYLVRCI
jgi:sodium/hydrogen exchanger-like protein 6/7